MTTKTTREIDSDPVLLRGGPMDGWYVKPNAPALRLGWGAEFGGWYEATAPNEDGIKTAEWRTVE
jgi:hypothetical protein